MPKKRPKREGIMLAYPAEEGRIERLGKEFLMQPKLRGERARVEWFHGEPVLISSYGNEFKFMDHLKRQIKRAGEMTHQFLFDGELYIHGWSQQEISAILRSTVNKHPKTEELEFHIFDICLDYLPQFKRIFLMLKLYEAKIFEQSHLNLVPTVICNRSNWIDQVNKYLDYGYEGGILRAVNSYWEPKRTVGMLKYKPTEKDEYIIVSVNEAIDKAGSPKGMVGSFTVKGDDGTEFKVGAGKLIHDKRISLWQERFELPRKILIVKHEPIKTKDGVPICAVAVDLKEEL